MALSQLQGPEVHPPACRLRQGVSNFVTLPAIPQLIVGESLVNCKIPRLTLVFPNCTRYSFQTTVTTLIYHAHCLTTSEGRPVVYINKRVSIRGSLTSRSLARKLYVFQVVPGCKQGCCGTVNQ